MERIDGRRNDELRPLKITRRVSKYAEGSALIELGDTKVLCAVSIESGVPSFLADKEQGWLTAEYGMLPRSTNVRQRREAVAGRLRGRTQEIKRLIARALRCIVDLATLPEKTIWIDCDVLQADGGTRTAAISGAYVALVDTIRFLRESELIEEDPLRGHIAAVSVGIVEGESLLDLDYNEDSIAEVDMNIVMTDEGKLVEIQGTAEGAPFSVEQMLELVSLADKGIAQIIACQREVLSDG